MLFHREKNLKNRIHTSSCFTPSRKWQTYWLFRTYFGEDLALLQTQTSQVTLQYKN